RADGVGGRLGGAGHALGLGKDVVDLLLDVLRPRGHAAPRCNRGAAAPTVDKFAPCRLRRAFSGPSCRLPGDTTVRTAHRYWSRNCMSASPRSMRSLRYWFSVR